MKKSILYTVGLLITLCMSHVANGTNKANATNGSAAHNSQYTYVPPPSQIDNTPKAYRSDNNPTKGQQYPYALPAGQNPKDEYYRDETPAIAANIPSYMTQQNPSNGQTGSAKTQLLPIKPPPAPHYGSSQYSDNLSHDQIGGSSKVVSQASSSYALPPAQPGNNQQASSNGGYKYTLPSANVSTSSQQYSGSADKGEWKKLQLQPPESIISRGDGEQWKTFKYS